MDTNENEQFDPTEEERRERATLAATLNEASLKNAYHSNVTPGAIYYLAELGKTIQEQSIRSRIPRKRSEAYRLSVALSQVVAKCIEFNDANNLEQVRLLLGLLVGDDGYGRDQIVKAVVGFDGDQRPKHEGGAGSWLKQKAGIQQQPNP